MKTIRSLLVSASILGLALTAGQAAAEEISPRCSFSGGVIKLAPGEAEKLFEGWAEAGHIILQCVGKNSQSFEVSAHRELTNGSVHLVNDKGEELDYQMHINGVEVSGNEPVKVMMGESGKEDQAISLPLSVLVPGHKVDEHGDDNYSNTVTLEVFLI